MTNPIVIGFFKFTLEALNAAFWGALIGGSLAWLGA
jgi:hypothetical protein